MSEHKHETIISKAQSAVSAKRILEEIAVAGSYIASGFSDGFIIFSKSKDSLVEEITVEKIKEREFVIKKTVKMVE